MESGKVNHSSNHRNAISAVLITKNAVDTIRPCLEALQQVCEEIIVVDTYSEDGTVEVCRELGIQLVSHDWLGYSATKNKGNELAKNDWILSVDADEVLSDELIRSLNKLVPQEGHVYSLDRLTSYCGQWIHHCGWYPDWKVRLFNRKQVWWKGDFVHETLSIPADSKVVKLKGKLFHYSYKSPEDHLQRIEKYAGLSAREQFHKGKKATFVKRWLSPPARFFRTYILKKGFLDGKAGLTISRRNAYMVYLRYKLLKKLWSDDETMSLL